MNSYETKAREYAPGQGEAVADRTINRLITLPDGTKRRETWAEVAERVAKGNVLLDHRGRYSEEFHSLHHHLRQASVLMSGRHLQHGDIDQSTRPQEVFTNCGSYETEVATLEQGTVKLGEVVGQTLTVRTADGSWQEATFNAHGEQDLYRLTFHRADIGAGSTREARFTRDHRWLLKDGTFTSNIQVGDVLAIMPVHSTLDDNAVVHGLVFGDGTAHKRRRDNTRPGVSQGRTYASIRVCKQDVVQRAIHDRLDDAGYHFTTPAHADGDRVYYIGKFEHAKELPFTRDPDYIAGFIHGWWLADGNKTEVSGTRTISTCDEQSVTWLQEHAIYAGLTITSVTKKERKPGDGSFVNGKPLFIIRMREAVEWKLAAIEFDCTEEVFCPEEPVTSTFTLANGLVTGNCSTAAATFITFYLLLNGSGVGRAYDDLMMAVDWNHMPIVVPTIDLSHPDVIAGHIHNPISTRQAEHIHAGQKITTFRVPDSREGWAKAIEVIERMAFEGNRRDEVLILDFSDVRKKGSPIKGMQDRPASGPAPIMNAINNLTYLRDAEMKPWRQAMYADHFLAECVLVGGARRAARMATKDWRDKTVLDFIGVKKGGFLWSSNNSVTVDEEFWKLATATREDLHRHESQETCDLAQHARTVLQRLAEHSYYDQTGEPGLINQDRLCANDEGLEIYEDGFFAGCERFSPDNKTQPLLKALFNRFKLSKYKYIVNPCGEIVLSKLGGYCVIADVVPYHAQHLNDAEDAFRAATRALIRVNTMECLYRREVDRTNRIGVGITGLHEFAWKFFRFGFNDLIDEQRSRTFWLTLSRFKRAIVEEAASYSAKMGVKTPHTNTTMKPAGTTSKLFGLSEAAHLPAMTEYLRYVQFRTDDPLVKQYADAGYPTKQLETYQGTTIVGFPTRPEICRLDMGSNLVTAAEATPEEQYQWLRLLEKYWIRGVAADGVTPLEETGNQVSYTLKYDPAVVSFDEFKRTLINGQRTVRCCSVMPSVDASAYEYQPETPISRADYDAIEERVRARAMKEDIGREHLDCASGACPISFNDEPLEDAGEPLRKD